MSPTVSQILAGNMRAMAAPTPAESGPGFAASKVGIIGALSMFAAIEAETGVAVRLAENRAIRALFAQAGSWAPALKAQLAARAQAGDEDLTMTGLDRANAELRTALIALHTSVEDDPAPEARNREREILRLLHDIAEKRRIELPRGR